MRRKKTNLVPGTEYSERAHRRAEALSYTGEIGNKRLGESGARRPLEAYPMRDEKKNGFSKVKRGKLALGEK